MDPDARTPRLFLSYSRHEHDDVRHLAQVIEKSGFTPFVDDAGLEGGHPWWDQLLLQIKHCDAFVPVLSAHYLDSVPCRREAEWAEALGKPVMPVMLEQVEPQATPPYIALSQWVPFTNRGEDELIVLTRALWKLPPCPALPDPLPPAPTVPISPVNAQAASIVQRLDRPDDLTRDEQAVLLSDMKALHTKAPQVALPLLVRFQNRDEVTANIHAEITALLDAAQVPHVQQPKRPSAPEQTEVTQDRAGQRGRRRERPATSQGMTATRGILTAARWLLILALLGSAAAVFNMHLNDKYGGSSTQTKYVTLAVVLFALAVAVAIWDWMARRRARLQRRR